MDQKEHENNEYFCCFKLKQWLFVIATIWLMAFVASLTLGEALLSASIAIVVLPMLLLVVLPENRLARTLNFLIQGVIFICLCITVVSTALVIYLD